MLKKKDPEEKTTITALNSFRPDSSQKNVEVARVWKQPSRLNPDIMVERIERYPDELEVKLNEYIDNSNIPNVVYKDPSKLSTKRLKKNWSKTCIHSFLTNSITTITM